MRLFLTKKWRKFMSKKIQPLVSPTLEITNEQEIAFFQLLPTLTVKQSLILMEMLAHEDNHYWKPVENYEDDLPLSDAPLLPLETLMVMTQTAQLQAMGFLQFDDPTGNWELTAEGKTLAQFLMYLMHSSIQHTTRIQNNANAT
jgi:hypothetical protein